MAVKKCRQAITLRSHCDCCQRGHPIAMSLRVMPIRPRSVPPLKCTACTLGHCDRADNSLNDSCWCGASPMAPCITSTGGRATRPHRNRGAFA